MNFDDWVSRGGITCVFLYLLDLKSVGLPIAIFMLVAIIFEMFGLQLNIIDLTKNTKSLLKI